VVLQGLGRLDVGRAAVGGLAIVLLAMTLDRITQSVAKSRGKSSPLRAALLRLVGRQNVAQPVGGRAARPT